MSESQAPVRQVRIAVRQHARRLLRDPSDVSAHFARLHAALELPGAEPVQGALADLFVTFGEREESLKRTALQMARDRLAVHAARWFEAQAGLSRLLGPAADSPASGRLLTGELQAGAAWRWY